MRKRWAGIVWTEANNTRLIRPAHPTILFLPPSSFLLPPASCLLGRYGASFFLPPAFWAGMAGRYGASFFLPPTFYYKKYDNEQNQSVEKTAIAFRLR